jgi:hypothetical protein
MTRTSVRIGPGKSGPANYPNRSRDRYRCANPLGKRIQLSLSAKDSVSKTWGRGGLYWFLHSATQLKRLLLTFHCDDPASSLGQFLWDMWWELWHCSEFFSEHFCFRCISRGSCSRRTKGLPHPVPTVEVWLPSCPSHKVSIPCRSRGSGDQVVYVGSKLTCCMHAGCPRRHGQYSGRSQYRSF